jgi:hypothetical protein
MANFSEQDPYEKQVQIKLSRIALSMQQALLGAVTPSLRAVFVDIEMDQKILFFFFYYDGEITNVLFNLASTACAKVSADFPEYVPQKTIVRLDAPQKISGRGRYVYRRHE